MFIQTESDPYYDDGKNCVIVNTQQIYKICINKYSDRNMKTGEVIYKYGTRVIMMDDTFFNLPDKDTYEEAYAMVKNMLKDELYEPS